MRMEYIVELYVVRLWQYKIAFNTSKGLSFYLLGILIQMAKVIHSILPQNYF